METILSYLDNMFAHMPKTAEVNRAKKELSQMMEDKYNQLRSEGKTENEAVGQVISEFGNLNELAEVLGISSQVQEATDDQHYILVSQNEAEQYIESQKKSAKLISIGLAVLFSGLMILMLFLALDHSTFLNEATRSNLPENFLGGIGVGILLFSIAIAVYFFIQGGMNHDRSDLFEREYVKLDSATKAMLQFEKEAHLPTLRNKIASGVSLILLGVTAIVLFGTLFNGADFYIFLGVMVLFLMIAIAIPLFVSVGMVDSAYEKLLNIGDYTLEKKQAQARTARIGGPYWGLVTVGYLAWSFITNDWQTTWIVWPIAGVAFGAIASIINAIATRKER